MPSACPKSRLSNARKGARIALAGIRLINGTIGLIAPQTLVNRVDPGQRISPASIYAFRMFGIRTVLLGAELLVRDGEELQRALRQGLIVHGSDVATCVLLGVQHKVPPRTAALLTGISTLNVTLAAISIESG